MTVEWAIAGAGILALAGSARWNWWRRASDGLPVLMYHKIGDPPRQSNLKKLWVREKDFRRQMKYLLNHGYRTLHFSEIERARTRLEELPAGARDSGTWGARSESETPTPGASETLIRGAAPLKPVLITFDDGYLNNYTLAFPMLAEMKMKANIFMVYDTAGRHNAWHNPSEEPWTRMLRWEHVREMMESSVFEFGSHTMTHRCLTEISPEEARWEITESKKRLEDKLGVPVTAFTCPYGAGAYSLEIRRFVKEAGYTLDFAIRQGKSPWPHDFSKEPLKRLLVRRDDNYLDFHLSMTRGKSRF